MENEKEFQERRERHKMERISYSEKGRFFLIRNILNTIFIILTAVGCGLFYWKSHDIGGMLLICAVVIKLAECVLRIIK